GGGQKARGKQIRRRLARLGKCPNRIRENVLPVIRLGFGEEQFHTTKGILDCGGKRSATPLFARMKTRSVKLTSCESESAVAAGALPAQSMTRLDFSSWLVLRSPSP